MRSYCRWIGMKSWMIWLAAAIALTAPTLFIMFTEHAGMMGEFNLIQLMFAVPFFSFVVFVEYVPQSFQFFLLLMFTAAGVLTIVKLQERRAVQLARYYQRAVPQHRREAS
ncbi:hypothetical protein [Alkalicoccus chagannorensis]|uniref:hypothetical protein n=1 Tax=Alkalicoccus chagannorensis TaxID=427072 RepID=UPI0004271B92|nr:hypothetical protein [Alkalicoccus chagannorensis]